MSSTHEIQDASGIIVRADGGDILLAAGETVPADAATGYATGCLFIHTDGTTGSGSDDLLWVNVGSTTSANFDAVTVI